MYQDSYLEDQLKKNIEENQKYRFFLKEFGLTKIEELKGKFENIQKQIIHHI